MIIVVIITPVYICSSHHTDVQVGFVDTLVEVNETDGNATLNVSITRPLPDPIFGFEIMFRLNVFTIDVSAGIDVIPNFS